MFGLRHSGTIRRTVLARARPILTAAAVVATSSGARTKLSSIIHGVLMHPRDRGARRGHRASVPALRAGRRRSRPRSARFQIVSRYPIPRTVSIDSAPSFLRR
jgi:hypothetical protein